MITHCPSCHTHFRVHPEQLAVRAGQVRCGKCSRVFDALEYLVQESAPEREAMAVRPSAMPAVAATAEAAPEPPAAEAARASAEGPEPVIEVATDFGPDTIQAATGTFDVALPEPAPVQLASVDADFAADPGAFDFGPRAAAEPARRARRWPWLLGALFLLALLAAQAAYHFRSALMVLVPQAKPYAATLCATLGCDLPLPRSIEMMSIEASDLQADTTNPNVMVLTATLKNRAIFDQQFPLLELTLTDAQDQPVVRRVLAPQDYIDKNANVGAGFAANSEIAIKVFIEGSQVKATGYRLYLFYP